MDAKLENVIKVERDVCQGFVLSPLPFNAYTDEDFQSHCEDVGIPAYKSKIIQKKHMQTLQFCLQNVGKTSIA